MSNSVKQTGENFVNSNLSGGALDSCTTVNLERSWPSSATAPGNTLEVEGGTETWNRDSTGLGNKLCNTTCEATSENTWKALESQFANNLSSSTEDNNRPLFEGNAGASARYRTVQYSCPSLQGELEGLQMANHGGASQCLADGSQYVSQEGLNNACSGDYVVNSLGVYNRQLSNPTYMPPHNTCNSAANQAAVSTANDMVTDHVRQKKSMRNASPVRGPVQVCNESGCKCPSDVSGWKK